MAHVVDNSTPVSLAPLRRLRQDLADLEGRAVTLLGLGLFGGGEGAARFLAERGARLTITDLRSEQQLAEPLQRLRACPARLRLGGHREEDFRQAALVVANPAVPRSNKFLRLARDCGASIASPMNIFLALCPAPVLAVTGANGKSTTTALVFHILKRAGRRAWLGGNIGVSLLPELPRIAADDVVALELSSFQLSDAGHLPWSPHVAVVTNLSPNHLNWHGAYESYVAAKRNIIRFQCGDDFAVLNRRDAELARWAQAPH
ncbi:MAG: UDP-N-acetylmuramoyl-L-alanine--D-glutamate ligase, partial [Planctomycetes bacterium]|nr:UDP-N-acetylmuramoyl-L-alanine--D-glutamate ligase [Planctomycetota bacterium]